MVPMSADSTVTDSDTLSIGVSIVLYCTPVTAIAELLRQLLSQGARLVYIIDNSPKEFDAFKGWVPPPRVISVSTRRNLGYGRANNLAIRDSVRRHAYHLICNPDVSLGPDTLGQLHRLLESRPDIGLCSPRIVGTDGQLHHLCKRLPSPMDLAIRRFAPSSWFASQRAYYEMRDQSYDRPMEAPFLSGCFMFFRSSVLSRLDGFDERYFLYIEDLDLSRRAAAVAHNIYVPDIQIVHVGARGAYKSLRLLRYFAVSVLRYFNKWGWFEQPWFASRKSGH
jgi:GT2 family glycosyltransferase